MVKLVLALMAVALAFVLLVDRRHGDRDAFAGCLEKRGVVVRDSTEFRELYGSIGAYEGVAEELDEHSLSIRTPESEGLAVVTGSEADARDVHGAFETFLNGYTTQRAGNVVVAWSLGPETSAASAVSSCAT